MKFARKTDLIIVALLVVVGVLVWVFSQGFFNRSGAEAEIYYKSALVKTVALAKGKDETFSISEVPEVVFHRYDDGSIAFEKSDCPDKVCIKTGRLHSAGQMAACLPNMVIIKIVGTGAADKDAPDVVIG